MAGLPHHLSLKQATTIAAAFCTAGFVWSYRQGNGSRGEEDRGDDAGAPPGKAAWPAKMSPSETLLNEFRDRNPRPPTITPTESENGHKSMQERR